jgi:1-deoxy-D-xylulose-5-phosphate synthase
LYNLENFDKKILASIEDKELSTLCTNIAEFIIQNNSVTGGHVGANLGTVDLTVALHKVFNTPFDTFVWDTGHTGYTHKILTGRGNLFSSLNTLGGMNRFISSDESEHDFVEVSHAGTSISLALGNALARKDQDNSFSVAIIGDGSLAEGVAMEALNHAVKEDVNLIIVLNDNGFAISPGFGGLHDHLENISHENIFTLLGYNYHGVLDGHDPILLSNKLNEIKELGGVHFVHLKTKKGFRYGPASKHPVRMHYSFAFDVEDGSLKETPENKPFQAFAADAILESMENDKNIFAITPSTLYATDLERVFNVFPDRCFDPGMEEQHAMSMACGMARAGNYPVVFYQSTFLQRAFDQLLHDIGFSNNSILILSVRSGFSGYDNPTHHGIYDLSYLRSIPNLEIFYPSNGKHLYRLIASILKNPNGPKLVFLPYGFDDEDRISAQGPLPAVPSKLHKVRDGDDCLIITLGNKVNHAIEAHNLLLKNNIEASVLNLNQIKPIQEVEILPIIKKFEYVFTLEENISSGGLSEAISKLILLNFPNIKFNSFSLPDTFIQGGSQDELSILYGLDPKSISKSILEFIEKN